MQGLDGREERVGDGHDDCETVVRPAGRDELRRLLFRRRVAEKVAAANLRTGEVLQQVRAAQRRVELDVEVEARRRRPSPAPGAAP